MRVEQYEMIANDNIESFNQTINRLILNGYEPFGNPAVNGSMFCQAMVKKIISEENKKSNVTTTATTPPKQEKGKETIVFNGEEMVLIQPPTKKYKRVPRFEGEE